MVAVKVRALVEPVGTTMILVAVPPSVVLTACVIASPVPVTPVNAGVSCAALKVPPVANPSDYMVMEEILPVPT